METNLKILEGQFSALEDQIRKLDQSAWKAMKAIEGKTGDFDFDFERYRSLKQKLQSQLPILESKTRRERNRVLKARRVEKKQELEALQPKLIETKAEYHKAQEVLEEKWKRHSLVELKAVQLEQQLLLDYEELRENQRALQSLISEITGIDEREVRPDGLSSTDNKLIR